MAIVDPDTSSPGGKPVTPDSEIKILRNLLTRVKALEDRLARSQGITFVSPDGGTIKTLSIDNNGNPLWT